MIPVTADWLVDTMALGRRQPEAHYRPLPPQGPPANTAATASRLVAVGGGEPSRASTGTNGCTQIGVTQLMGGMALEQQASGDRHGEVAQQQQVAAPAAAEPPGRQQLVLPPPPGPQQEAPAGTGGRRMSLRERLRANQAAAAGVPPSSGGGWPAEPQQQQQPVNDENVAGRGSNSGGGAADLLQLGGKQQMTTRFQQSPAQPEQRSALDDAMESLDLGAEQVAAAAGAQPAPQPGAQQAPQQAQPQLPSMFEQLFGPSPGNSPAVPPAAAPASAGAPAPAPAAPAAAGVKPEPPAQQATPKQPAGRGSGRATRTSSRLRPADLQQQAPAEHEQPAAPEHLAAREAAPPPVAAEPAAVPAGGSEPQEDMAMAIDRWGAGVWKLWLVNAAIVGQMSRTTAKTCMLHRATPPSRVPLPWLAALTCSLGRLLGGLPAEVPPRIGSQLDALMPPPPARTRGGTKRGAPAQAESSLSNGSGGSRGGRAAKRQLDDDGPASGGSSGRAQTVRRSGRGRAAELQQAVSWGPRVAGYPLRQLTLGLWSLLKLRRKVCKSASFGSIAHPLKAQHAPLPSPQAPHLEMSQQVGWHLDAHGSYGCVRMCSLQGRLLPARAALGGCMHAQTTCWVGACLAATFPTATSVLTFPCPSPTCIRRRWATPTARTTCLPSCPPGPPPCRTTSC